jgi:hypothetical protein
VLIESVELVMENAALSGPGQFVLVANPNVPAKVPLDTTAAKVPTTRFALLDSATNELGVTAIELI